MEKNLEVMITKWNWNPSDVATIHFSDRDFGDIMILVTQIWWRLLYVGDGMSMLMNFLLVPNEKGNGVNDQNSQNRHQHLIPWLYT